MLTSCSCLVLEKTLAAWSLDWGTLNQLQDGRRLTPPQQCLLVKSLLLSGLHTPWETAAGMPLLTCTCMPCHHTHPAYWPILFKALCQVTKQAAPAPKAKQPKGYTGMPVFDPICRKCLQVLPTSRSCAHFWRKHCTCCSLLSVLPSVTAC